jgi:hypothetical protein
MMNKGITYSLTLAQRINRCQCTSLQVSPKSRTVKSPLTRCNGGLETVVDAQDNHEGNFDVNQVEFLVFVLDQASSRMTKNNESP